MPIYLGGRIETLLGDITRLEVDAIVNAANPSLLGGGGVDGAIHAAAGGQLLDACRALGGAAHGEAKLTGGYRLPARQVIHAVGPIWQGGRQGEDAILARCYRACLDLAHAHTLHTLAFPAISTGVYAFPLERATRIAVQEVRAGLARYPEIARAIFCCFSPEAQQTYDMVLREPAPTR